jgi:D-3-phosphoglycerate dehydrogenase / 2-oxoglutarate reductase
MKLVGIGDLFIPHEYIKSGFAQVEALGVSVTTFDWELSGFQELQAINLQVEKGGSAAYDPPPEVYKAVREADILITQFCPIPSSLIAAAERLKALGVLRAGYENIDVAAATERGIVVLNTPGRNADAVADFAVGMILSEARNIARGHAALKEGRWAREYPNSGMIPDMPGKTVGLVGLGEIGRKVARRLSGFDVELLAYDPFVKEPPAGVKMVRLAELMARSDFVSVHARLTKETEGMIGSELIGKMKKTAYLVNTSRSALVDEKALYAALESGRIAGAALDVFDLEPPGADYPLVRLPNVTVTPHMAGGSNDAFYNCPKLLAAEFAKLLAGGEPRSAVNREVLAEARSRLGV